MTDPKPLAKSLHTLSVVVRLACNLAVTRGLSSASAVAQALVILDLPQSPDMDPHGIVEKAIEQVRARVAG